jgi:hypothetical protein
MSTPNSDMESARKTGARTMAIKSGWAFLGPRMAAERDEYDVCRVRLHPHEFFLYEGF